jgi:uncharacterized protein involved in outer membrane biogenesis
MIVRRILIALAGCAALVMVAVLGVAACIDAGLFRSAVIRFISIRAGRPIGITGPLRIHLFVRHPNLSAEGVTIGNPPWVPAGQFAQVGEISLAMDAPWFDGAFGIVGLSMKSATLHLVRDASGYANWQWRNPDSRPSTKKLPILRSLSIPDAQVLLDDQRRHLQFEGIVSADGGDGAGSHLTIEAVGKLNGHSDTFDITGDPLSAASHHIPYRYSFSERSSGSELTGQGILPEPFDFNLADASFDAAGADLKDLYFLTGVTFIHSGSYRLSGRINRRGNFTRFADLAAQTGQSDVRGTVEVQVSGGRPRLNVELDSTFLRMADLGLRASGRASETGAPPLLVSNALFDPAALRRVDADLRYGASRLTIGRVMLADVAAKGTLEQGVLTVAPVTAGILAGKLQAHAQLDAKTDDPKARIDIDIAGLQLGDIGKDPSAPPATGLLRIQVSVSGTGRSLHQIAASANGTVAAAVRQGTVRDSLAEMTGFDLRGLGLMVAKSGKEIALRCAMADFEAREGTLSAKRFVADTESVLITGTGQIRLDDEALDLAISGHPKQLRLLRFQAPILIRGTLSHPAIDIQPHRLTLFDPGTAQHADCATPDPPTFPPP